MSETVQTLVSLQDFQPSRAHIFPSIESLRWYLRKHRPELVTAGAVLTIAGRTMLDPTAFDRVILEQGRIAAGRATS